MTVAEREREPLVPVIVIVYDPGAVAMQDKVLVPDPPGMDVGVRLHVMPVVGESASVRDMVLVNPFADAIVIVEV